MGTIAERWRVLSGESDWEGLLDPLDLDLRGYLIHYGDRVQAAVDGLIEDKNSKNIALPRYIRKHLFSKVGLVTANPYDYVVEKYLYATYAEFTTSTDGRASGNSNWLGFVAVTTDEGKVFTGRRDILISLRGSIFTETEWIYIDVHLQFTPASGIFGTENDPQVYHGFYSYYTWVDQGSKYNSKSLRDQILETVRKLVDQYKDEDVSITLTGHSMGASIAILSATDIVYNGYNKPTDQPDKAFPVTVFSFAGPAIGDIGFSNVFSALDNLHVLRVNNNGDIIADFPVGIEGDPGYQLVGTKLLIDSTKSPSLKSNVSKHELLVYLQTLAGYNSEVNRDPALVNKRLDGILDEYLIPTSWWGEKNTSFIQLDNGFWELILDREIDDDDEAA